MTSEERKEKYAEAFRLLDRANEILEHIDRECSKRGLYRESTPKIRMHS